MICKSIEYFNFRNIESARIEPSPGVNVLFGNNAEGKTNAVEGIYLFSCGRSFRAHADSEMIRFGEKKCFVKLIYCDSTGEKKLDFSLLANGKRSCRKNGIQLSRLSEFVGNFHAVLFCPEHLSLVKEGPSVRRSFLDMAISQLSPVYLGTLQRYYSVLRQRNGLLKQRLFSGKEVDREFRDMIEIWSDQLAKEAEYISKARYEYVMKLEEKTKVILSDMTQKKDNIEITYPDPVEKAVFFERFTSFLERELKAGGTLYGIHRDDMKIKLNEKEARSFSSQGQQRSAALAMKLSEGEIVRDNIGEYPVFLLDDILSELDDNRKRYILDGLLERQVIITSCGKDIGGEKRFYVNAGSYNLTE